MTQPNVLFLFSDEHNAKCLGHGLNSQVKTPNLDRLAAEGTRFSRAVTQSPICTPSRICFASGQYSHNHGYYGLAAEHDGPNLMDNLPHLYGHFKTAGYAVGAVGKSHLPPGWIESSCDRFVEDKDVEFGYPAFLRRQGIDPARSAGLNWGGKKIKAGGTDKFNHDFGPDELPYELSAEHWEASEAIDFMRTHGEQPFFLQVGFWRPHTPCTPSPEFWDMYPEEHLQEPPNADYEMSGKSPLLQERRQMLENLPPEKFVFDPPDYRSMRRRYLRGYYGCISQVDHAIGEILDALENLGLADNTIVVYSTDHGDFAIEHGIVEKAPGIFADAVTRIPFIWRWPGKIAADHESQQLVQTVDLAPTLCSLTGVEPMPTADGMDLTGLLQGNEQAVREVAVTENPCTRVLYHDRYRYVHVPEGMRAEGGEGELYDLLEDPWEMHNLIREPGYQEVVEDIRSRLLDWLLSTQRVVSVHPSLDRSGERAAKGRRRHPVDADGKRAPAYIQEIAEKCGRNYL